MKITIPRQLPGCQIILSRSLEQPWTCSRSFSSQLIPRICRTFILAFFTFFFHLLSPLVFSTRFFHSLFSLAFSLTFSTRFFHSLFSLAFSTRFFHSILAFFTRYSLFPFDTRFYHSMLAIHTRYSILTEKHTLT